MQKDPEETQGAASPYHSTVPFFPFLEPFLPTEVQMRTNENSGILASVID